MGIESLKRLLVRPRAVTRRPKIYMASKTYRAESWRALRSVYPIVSRWIDKPDGLSAAEYRRLWIECIEDAAERADLVIVFASEGDTLKGCLIECGAALGAGKPVYQVGDCHSLRAGDGSDASFVKHPRWHKVPEIGAAVGHWQLTYAGRVG